MTNSNVDIKIVIQDGRVIEVYSSDKYVNVEIIDKDVTDEQSEEEVEQAIEKMVEDLFKVY